VKAAQAQFIKDDYLNKFSSQYAQVDTAKLPILEKMLVESGLEFNNLIRKNLEKSGAIATGKLADVSAPQVYELQGGYQLQIGYPVKSKQIEYYDYVNQGVKGRGGKNAKLKKNSGKYKFRNKYVGKAMAASLYSWLNQARKKVALDTGSKTKVQRKNIKLSKALKKADNKRTLAYVMGKAIKRDGLKATYYFDRAVKETFNNEFITSVGIALEGDITLNIRQVYGNYNSKQSTIR
jgi:hypothetical protein